MSGDVRLFVRRVDPTYTVEVEVYGAPERRRKYAKHSIIPDLLVIRYNEKAHGWQVSHVDVHGSRVTKSGLGSRYSDSIWTSDLPSEEQWVKDAIRENCPKVRLR